jgi:hypothetical protein
MLRCASLSDSRPRIMNAVARQVWLRGSQASSWLSREKASLNSCRASRGSGKQLQACSGATSARYVAEGIQTECGVLNIELAIKG